MTDPLRVTVKGMAQLRTNVAHMIKQTDERVRKAVAQGLAAIHGDAVRAVLRGPKSGKLYGPRDPKSGRRLSPEQWAQRQAEASEEADVFGGNAGKIAKRDLIGSEHRASAPGEAPATDEGKLASSIKMATDKDGHSGYVFSDAAYAPWLEFGTRKIRPRPFMMPALEKHRKAIDEAIKAAYRGSLPPKT